MAKLITQVELSRLADLILLSAVETLKANHGNLTDAEAKKLLSKRANYWGAQVGIRPAPVSSATVAITVTGNV
jgi:hypothetical protein